MISKKITHSKIDFQEKSMPIYIHEKDKIYHLKTVNSSYVIKVQPQGQLSQLYWGPLLETDRLSQLARMYDRGYTEKAEDIDLGSMEDINPSECPCYGQGDFRPPMIEVRNTDGSSIVDFRFKSAEQIQGKPELPGLPALYAEKEEEAETLKIVLKDSLTQLELTLLYSIFHSFDAVIRSASITNLSDQNVRLERMMSSAVHIPETGLDMISLSGSWGRERHLYRQNLRSGSISIESTRGESSHQQSPFIALMESSANETQGSVYGFSLIYSGNFLAQAEVDQFDTTRVLMGINPFDFSWLLTPGESFQTPETVMVYSSSGLEGMSRSYHNLYRKHLARGFWRDRERPILANNWEATYFDFDADKIESIATTAGEAGIELFVLDDGWFGHRDSDNSSLGDWFVYKEKLPGGLKDLSERVQHQGLKFGLWFEPEMISPDSELYRENPDWCVHVPGRKRTEIRNQLVLDITRQEVRDYIVERVSSIIEENGISYVKWDMNRPLTEMGSAKLPAERQREFAHRYCLGMYDMMDRVTSRFPEILFESCSGGGARFDGGVMHYMPQAWTSDDMDPWERLKIQWSTSLVFPASMMGAHVCSSPNHSTGRETPLKTRAAVAMSGAFGYELDLTQFSTEELEEVKTQVAYFKEIRRLVQFGDFYRLRSPYESDDGSWMYVNQNRFEAFVMFTKVVNPPNPPVSRIPLRGLDSKADYRVVEGFQEGLKITRDSGEIYNGSLLMNAGLPVPRIHGQLQSMVWRLVKV